MLEHGQPPTVSAHIVKMRLLLSFLAGLFAAALASPFTDANAVANDSAYGVEALCPGYLPALPGFEFPHLIIPISASNPTTPYANTLVPYITAGDFSNIFNFDIPQERIGQMCTFEFLFPAHTQLNTSFFQLAGPGTFIFSLSPLGMGAVEGNTTFDNQPLPAYSHGYPRTISMEPGNAYTLGATICVPGRISVTMASPGSNLTWFQDYNPCAIGLYITYSD
jgi:hypothetical protein